MRPDAQDPLSRIWAATRPDEPSGEAFDALWGRVTTLAHEPEVLSMSRPAGWRRWGLGAAVFAQAAALLIAAVASLNPPKLAPVQSRPDHSDSLAAKEPEVRGAAGFTTYVSLGLDSIIQGVEIRPETVDSDTDMVTAEADILGFMEACESSTPPPAVLDFTESYW